MSAVSLQRLLLRNIIRLDFGSCGFGHIRRQQLRIERVCRSLLAIHDPAGAVYLASVFRCWGYSHVDKELQAIAYSASLYATYLPRLLAKRSKGGFDCYCLGLEYQRGNKTGRNLAASRALFRRAFACGIGLAKHEWIMSTMADDSLPDAEKIRVFTCCRGKAARFSLYARNLFVLTSVKLEDVPDPHDWMRLLLDAWKMEVYSTMGKQFLKLRVETCIKIYLASIQARHVLTGNDYFMLAKVAESSRVHGHGSKPFELYRSAALLGHPEAAEWYVRLTPEQKRETIEYVIRQGFNGSIPSRLDECIRDKFEDY